MASTITATTGLTDHRPILDLDAGTTLPRVAQVALIAVLLGALVVLALAARPGDEPAASHLTGVRPAALTVPALRAPWAPASGRGNSPVTIGPVAAIAPLAAQNPAVSQPAISTGTTHDRD